MKAHELQLRRTRTKRTRPRKARTRRTRSRRTKTTRKFVSEIQIQDTDTLKYLDSRY